jgi:hypothetical protein
MGMYDSLLVAESLLSNLIRDNNIKLKSFNGYYDFQTKDLDNFLTTFCLQADESFVWEKREYTYVEPEFTSTKKWNFGGTLKQVSEPVLIEDTRTAYVEFYDLYESDGQRCFVTFKAHVKNGKLVEPITLVSIERTDLKKEAEELKKTREKWAKTEDTWQWQLAMFISETRWKVYRFFVPFVRRLDEIEKNLRDEAKTLNDLP